MKLNGELLFGNQNELKEELAEGVEKHSRSLELIPDHPPSYLIQQKCKKK